MPSKLRTLPSAAWDALIEYCALRDVEEGETAEYMYSVRRKTRTITIWTRNGWKGGWYVARATVHPTSQHRVKIDLEPGTAPVDKQWKQEDVEQHFKELLSRLTGEVI